MHITEKQNKACFIGSLESILCDSIIPDSDKNSILENFLNVTNDNNVTYIQPFEIEAMLSNFFKDFRICKIDKLENLSSCTVLEFTLLIWEGKNSENRHVTRFIELNNQSVLLMDPQLGKKKDFTFDDLKELSPNGFTFVSFNRK